MAAEERYLKPMEYAKKLGVDLKKVLQWIRSGELSAVDVSTRAGGQPRWKIPPSAIESFEARRSSKSSGPPVGRRRRVERDPGWVDYF